jgi:hypothetical protein
VASWLAKSSSILFTKPLLPTATYPELHKSSFYLLADEQQFIFWLMYNIQVRRNELGTLNNGDQFST